MTWRRSAVACATGAVLVAGAGRPSVAGEAGRALVFASARSAATKTAVPDDADAQILQVLRRQALQDPLVDFIVAERRLIPFEAKATQPLPEVHSRALNSPLARNHRPGETMCPGGHDASSLDHLVGAGHQRRGHSHAHRLSGLEVDHQLELGRLFDRDVGNFDAAEELDELSGHYL